LTLLGLSALEALEKIGGGEISPLELTDAYLAQIERYEGDVNAYLHLDAEGTRSEARAAGDGPLAGLPTAIKDVLCTRGVTTTCGSRMLEDFKPVYTATCVEQMQEAGIVSLGKTNMDEFAMGSSTENSAFGPTLNPWDTGRVPGGSSGGSAAAVAAREALWALGTDTGGSIRQPASFCGVVGLKPTYGAVSRYGLVAFASSFDQVGPITKTVADAALMLRHLVGKDPLDSTSVAHPEEILIPEDGDLAGLRIGIVRELTGGGVDVGVSGVFNRAIDILAGLGAEMGEVSLPHVDYCISAYYILAPAEASANLARYDGVRYGHRAKGATDVNEMYEATRSEGFGDEVKRRIMLGTYVLSSGYYDAYYGQAQKVRTLVVRDFDQAFGDFDLLVSPTTPTPAFGLGERVDDPLTMYMSDVCTTPANLAGIPAISIPAGKAEGLPVGLQFFGPAFSENKLLSAAHRAEAAIGFDEEPPMLGGQG
jgi:aspartyl-tRNA(Asn)/glutamyl-tRNA(Gln) amidotransferase subunit A